MLHRAIATIGSLTFVSRILGFARDMLIARTLGAGLAADAFFLAFRLPNLFRRLLGEGAFNAAFVPIFAQLLQKDGRERAVQFAASTFSILVLANLALLLLFELFMPLAFRVLAPGFAVGSERYVLALDLARIMFPYLMLITLAAQCAAMLNAVHHFGHAAVMPILLNVCMLASLLLFEGPEHHMAHVLAWSVTAAGVAQLGYIWISLRTVDLSLYPAKPARTPEIRRFFRLFGPGVLGAGVYQLNVTVDVILASLLGEGAISWLNYADRLNQLPLGVIGVALGTALLPMLSRQIKGEDWQAARRTQAEAIRIAMFVSLPATTAFAIMAAPIVSILFQRGAFTPHDSEMTARALQMFAAGLPAYMLVKIFSASFFAQQDTRTPVKVAMVGLGSNVALNVVFILLTAQGRCFDIWGGAVCGWTLPVLAPLLTGVPSHVGIALATSLSAWLSAFLLARRLQGTAIAPHWRDTGGYIIKVLAACAGMAAVVLGLLHVLVPYTGGASSLWRMAALGMAIGGGAGMYFMLAGALKIGNWKGLKAKLKRPAVAS
jgi:putative peptidoglycan lipid II flippase